jgi:hypothetical protein
MASGQLDLLGGRALVAAQAADQRARQTLVGVHRYGALSGLIGLGIYPGDAVDELEQEVGALEQSLALLALRHRQCRVPGKARAAAEVARHEVHRQPAVDLGPGALAQPVQIGLARCLSVDQPPQHDLEVPAGPPVCVAAWRPGPQQFRARPVAVEDPVGELVQVGPLHEPT